MVERKLASQERDTTSESNVSMAYEKWENIRALRTGVDVRHADFTASSFGREAQSVSFCSSQDLSTFFLWLRLRTYHMAATREFGLRGGFEKVLSDLGPFGTFQG